ncbi:MAG: hypothetical protein K2M98_05290, partial [Muribaculum sp.]|nr:hypothetical protein [Muribaculum sp.]
MGLYDSINRFCYYGAISSLRAVVLLCSLFCGLQGAVCQEVWEEISTTVYKYDDMRRLSGGSTSGAGGDLSSRTYEYDAVGNVTTLTDGITGMTHYYGYDGYHRLQMAIGDYGGGAAQYGVALAYDGMHRITGKAQQLFQTDIMFPGQVEAGYELEYQYSAKRKFQLSQVVDRNYRTPGSTSESWLEHIHRYSYDPCGNLTGIETSRVKLDGHVEPHVAERRLLWDEESRLRALDDNGYVSVYLYDGDGNRSVKLRGGVSGGYINGDYDGTGGSTVTDNYTIYPHAGTVFSTGNKLTRHIYAGSERRLSTVGFGYDLGSQTPVKPEKLCPLKNALQDSIRSIYATFDVPFHGSGNESVNLAGLLGQSGGDSGAAMAQSQTHTAVYFYHPDHLGSSTLMTDE